MKRAAEGLAIAALIILLVGVAVFLVNSILVRGRFELNATFLYAIGKAALYICAIIGLKKGGTWGGRCVFVLFLWLLISRMFYLTEDLFDLGIREASIIKMGFGVFFVLMYLIVVVLFIKSGKLKLGRQRR